MDESFNPSLLSEYYPTSSSSLQQHTYLRVLWLPLSVCFLWSGETLGPSNVSTPQPVTSPSSGAGSFSTPNRSSCGPASVDVSRSSFSDRHAEAFVDEDETVSGYEVALRRCLTVHPPVQAAQLNWDAFSPAVLKSIAALAKTANAPVELPFFLTSDLGTSHWENMDGHRATVAVVVVVNAAVLPVSADHAVDLVHTILTSQFKDKVCRCVVVDGPVKLQEKLTNSPVFLCVSSDIPVEQTAASLLLDVAQAVVNAQGAALSLYNQPGKADNTLVRTPMDKSTTFAPSRTASTMTASRFKKKCGDILLQCGAVTTAVAAYGETQFGSNADCLWCSATVESIAAARYHYLRTTLLRHRAAVDSTVVQLQSDDPPWGPELSAAVEELGIIVGQYGDSLKLTLSSLKGSSVPHSMQNRLIRDIDENVSSQITLLKSLLVRVRVCMEARTWEVASDPRSYRLGSDVRRCVENVFRLAYAEVDVYLRESLRQLSKAAPSGGLWSSSSPPLGGGGGSSGSLPNPTVTMLRKRELETRFKRLELLAARESRQPFLEELSALRSTFPGGYGAEWTMRCLPFFAYLCMVNGAERRARALLVEMAGVRTRLQLVEGAADMLLRVCALAGLGLPLGGLKTATMADMATVEKGNIMAAVRGLDPLCRLSRLITERSAAAAMGNGGVNNSSAANVSITAAPFNMFSAEEDSPDRGVARLNQSINNAALLNVPLLLELIELFGRMGPPTSTAALRCQLATLLLFQHPHLLDKTTQRTLKSIMEETSGLLEPQVPATIVPPPFFLAWEALPLPPHLAPKTVPVGGALFTFIDTQRLKLTILCLNGKVLGSRTVWTVGDVASVLVTLYNPFEEPLIFGAVALRCRIRMEKNGCDSSNGSGGSASTPTAAGEDVALHDPICYVLSQVEVMPLAKRKVLLQVQPTQEGTLVIDGVAFRLSHMQSSQPIVGQLPAPMHIPVLQRLPQVSCTLNTSELEVFGSQRIDFTVRVVNCGSVPISCISLTAHSEQCQLEGCEGCKERRTDTDTTVTLNKRALDAASRVPLQPGDVVMIPGVLEAPQTIAKFGAHYVLFRTDLSLPHPEPEKPPNVPSAVPIYAVIPRRVTETRMRLFHSPGLVVTSVALTKDRRAVEVRVANRSRLYSMELQLSALDFADLPDAFIVAGAEYVVPPIKLTRILPLKEKNGLRFSVPWVVRELPHCAGTLSLDLSVIAAEEVSAEPLDECMLTLDVEVSQIPLLPIPHQLSASSVGSLDEANEAAQQAAGLGMATPSLSEQPAVAYRWATGGDACYGGDCSPVVVACARELMTATTVSGIGVSSSMHSPSSASGLLDRRATPSGGEGGGAVVATAVVPDLSSSARSTSVLMPLCTESFEASVAASTLQRAKTMVPLRSDALPTTTTTHNSAVAPPAKVDIVIPAVTPIHLSLCVAAPRWRRAIPLRVRVSIDAHFDVAVLTGAVDAAAMVGDEGRAVYFREFELFAFKTGKHLLHVTITDGAGRELTNTVQLIVEHSRAP